MMAKKKKMTIGMDEYIKANKKLAREEELARNGGRWIAKDRPHKNLKKYDRKRDKKNFDSYLSLSLLSLSKTNSGCIFVSAFTLQKREQENFHNQLELKFQTFLQSQNP